MNEGKFNETGKENLPNSSNLAAVANFELNNTDSDFIPRNYLLTDNSNQLKPLYNVNEKLFSNKHCMNHNSAQGDFGNRISFWTINFNTKLFSD
jgi:hypothetical protein